MSPDRPDDVERLEADFREALRASSPVRTSECLEPDGLLDIIEQLRAGHEPEALAHVASCSWCRREYATLTEAIVAADALRSAASNTEVGIGMERRSEGPSERGAGLMDWLSGMWRTPSFRLGLAGATACATAVLGYLVGTSKLPTVPDAPVASSLSENKRLTEQLARSQEDLRSANLEVKRLEARLAQASARAARLAAAQRLKPTSPRTGLLPPVSLAPVVRSVGALGRALVRIPYDPDLLPRGGDHTAMMEPAGTWLLDDRPTFRCTLPGADKTTRYTLEVVPLGGVGAPVVHESTGRELVWRPWMRFPRGQKFTWTVKAAIGGHESVGWATFGVLTEDEAARVAGMSKGLTGLKLARLYRNAGLLLHAEEVLASVRPGSRDYETAQALLGEIRNLADPVVQRTPIESGSDVGPEHHTGP